MQVGCGEVSTRSASADTSKGTVSTLTVLGTLTLTGVPCPSLRAHHTPWFVASVQYRYSSSLANSAPGSPSEQRTGRHPLSGAPLEQSRARSSCCPLPHRRPTHLGAHLCLPRALHPRCSQVSGLVRIADVRPVPRVDAAFDAGVAREVVRALLYKGCASSTVRVGRSVVNRIDANERGATLQQNSGSDTGEPGR